MHECRDADASEPGVGKMKKRTCLTRQKLLYAARGMQSISALGASKGASKRLRQGTRRVREALSARLQ